jgi:hypothetical protein
MTQAFNKNRISGSKAPIFQWAFPHSHARTAGHSAYASSKSARVLFVPTYKLIQRLLEAKRELKLEALLKKLDGYAVIILD